MVLGVAELIRSGKKRFIMMAKTRLLIVTALRWIAGLHEEWDDKLALVLFGYLLLSLASLAGGMVNAPFDALRQMLGPYIERGKQAPGYALSPSDMRYPYVSSHGLSVDLTAMK